MLNYLFKSTNISIKLRSIINVTFFICQSIRNLYAFCPVELLFIMRCKGPEFYHRGCQKKRDGVIAFG